ncbi:PRC and DUF2382 domain-containing protein [Nonomuraea recticatena]|uniref:PRC and DUF2382 domain-containing protein n=1 Tax=Nonomuraea recticatena TaxID=46178 RepID=UPI0031F894B8
MITQEQIQTVIGRTVFDRDGAKVGEVKNVYLDDHTNEPEWLTVRTGLFGMHESFVPLRTARVDGDRVDVTYDKAMIKGAPRVDVESGGHLSLDEERELYRYYGLDWSAASGRQSGDGRGPVPGQGAGRKTGRSGDTGTSGAGLPTQAGRSDEAMTRSEEHLRVGKERRESGRARLRKYVVTETEQVTVPVTREEVRLEREPITDANRDAAMRGKDISEAEYDETLYEERAVVDTEAVPVERVRLAKEQVTDQETVSGQVRRERVETDGDVRDERERRGRR